MRFTSWLLVGVLIIVLLMGVNLAQLLQLRERTAQISNDHATWMARNARYELEGLLAATLNTLVVSVMEFGTTSLFIWVESPLRDEQINAETVQLIAATVHASSEHTYERISVLMRSPTQVARYEYRPADGDLYVTEVTWERARLWMTPVPTVTTSANSGE